MGEIDQDKGAVVVISTKRKLRGCAFKGTILKNTTGVKDENLMQDFMDKEFLLDSFSSKYVYGFPVGHFGDNKYRFQFDTSSVKFYSDSQVCLDSSPYINLTTMICSIADHWK